MAVDVAITGHWISQKPLTEFYMTLTIKSQEVADGTISLQWDKHNGYEVVHNSKPYNDEKYGKVVRTLKTLSYADQESAERGYKRQIRKIR